MPVQSLCVSSQFKHSEASKHIVQKGAISVWHSFVFILVPVVVFTVGSSLFANIGDNAASATDNATKANISSKSEKALIVLKKRSLKEFLRYGFICFKNRKLRLI